jgi:ferritin-like metal-binding protein YciE
MKASKPKSTPAHDEFEIALVTELRHLRNSEKQLQRMYPRLKNRPQLMSGFMQQLADMQMRAERLDAVLNPIGALQYSQLAAQAVNSSAA